MLSKSTRSCCKSAWISCAQCRCFSSTLTNVISQVRQITIHWNGLQMWQTWQVIWPFLAYISPGLISGPPLPGFSSKRLTNYNNCRALATKRCSYKTKHQYFASHPPLFWKTWGNSHVYLRRRHNPHCGSHWASLCLFHCDWVESWKHQGPNCRRKFSFLEDKRWLFQTSFLQPACHNSCITTATMIL